MAQVDVKKVLVTLNNFFDVTDLPELELNEAEEKLVEEVIELLLPFLPELNVTDILSNTEEQLSHSSSLISQEPNEIEMVTSISDDLNELPMSDDEGKICPSTSIGFDEDENNSLDNEKYYSSLFEASSSKDEIPFFESSQPSTLNDEQTETNETGSDEIIQEKKAIRDYIENHEYLLHICPYCEHRSKTGNYGNIVRHMILCERRTRKSGEEMKPIKIFTLEEFIRYPLFRASSPIKVEDGTNEYDDDEAMMVRYIEEGNRKCFLICPYCEKRTKFGDDRTTKIHIQNCTERNNRKLNLIKVFSLKQFVMIPEVVKN